MVGQLRASAAYRAAPAHVQLTADTLLELAWKSTGVGFVSAEKLAARLGCSVRQAKRRRLAAVRWGLVEVRVRGGGRGRANGYQLPARIAATHPADNRPCNVAGQKPIKGDTRDTPQEVPSYVNLRTRDYFNRGAPAREEVPPVKTPKAWPPAPACAVCQDQGVVLTGPSTAERCTCQVIIDTRAARQAGRIALVPPPRPEPARPPDSIDNRPLVDALARIQRRAEQRDRAGR